MQFFVLNELAKLTKKYVERLKKEMKSYPPKGRVFLFGNHKTKD